MKICIVKGVKVNLLSNDHCPPHVHVKGKDWTFQIEFSFINNEVKVYRENFRNVTPSKQTIESIVNVFLDDKFLIKARHEWIENIKNSCLLNKTYSNNRKIRDVKYDSNKNITELYFDDHIDVVRITL